MVAIQVGFKWDIWDSAGPAGAMSRPARRVPCRRQCAALSCRALTGFALHAATLTRATGTFHRTMVRVRQA